MNERLVEDIKNRVDLVEIVRKYADLKKSGKNFMCRSPFRNEKTPSFSISPEKQMWYDFGTSEGGDVFSFIEKIENCSFLEAVEFLAESAGIEIPKEINREKGISKEEKKDIFSLHEKATEFFAMELQKSERALNYCASRKISSVIIKHWRLGYGGEDSHKNALTKFLLQAGFPEALIQQSGVSFERSFGDKSMLDRFWGRVMIPICEPREGKIIAFSGRDILQRENTGKYVNSPENPVYHKSATLFGLEKARSFIRELDFVILVEGNFDVVFAHDRGFKNTVATCGTSFTEEHLRILKRFTQNFYLAFDNDIAGKKATLRAVEMCLQMEVNPFVISLNSAKDFGEFLMDEKNAEVLQIQIETCPNALEFFLERFAIKNLDGSIEGEKKFLDAFFYFLKLVNRPIEVDEFLDRIALKLHRAKSIIQSEFEKFLAKKTEYTKPRYEEEKIIKFTREENFLGFLSAYWDLFSESILPRKLEFLDLFLEPQTRILLEKKLENTLLNDAEQQKLLALEMWQSCFLGRSEHSFSEDPPSESVLREMFKFFVQMQKQEKAKKERLEIARNLKVGGKEQ